MDDRRSRVLGCDVVGYPVMLRYSSSGSRIAWFGMFARVAILQVGAIERKASTISTHSRQGIDWRQVPFEAAANLEHWDRAALERPTRKGAQHDD